jgi:hypothetical protein
MLNLLVMAFYGGAMPVRADALAAAGYAAPPGSVVLGSKDIVVQSTPLTLLSDWMVLAYGARTLIVSPGDLVALAGILYWLLCSYSIVERDSDDVISRHHGAVRPAHALVAGAERAAGPDTPGAAGRRQPDRRRKLVARSA